MTLTPRQTDVAVFIRAYRHQHGMAPTLAEMADHFGLSKAAVNEHVVTLRQKGVIQCEKYMTRSISIVDDSALPPLQRRTRLAVLGSIN